MYLKSYVLEIMKNDTKSCKILVLVIQLNQTHMNHLQLAKYFPRVIYLFHPGIAEVWNIAVSCLEFSYIWQRANCESSTSEQIALPKVVSLRQRIRTTPQRLLAILHPTANTYIINRYISSFGRRLNMIVFNLFFLTLIYRTSFHALSL